MPSRSEELAEREGFEPFVRRFSKLLMARDFWSKTLVPQQLGDMSKFSRVLMRPLDATRVLETFWRRPSVSLHSGSRRPLVCRAISARPLGSRQRSDRIFVDKVHDSLRQS